LINDRYKVLLFSLSQYLSVIHPHKDSQTYSFYESDVYQKSIAFGELGEMVLLLANGALVTNVIYQ